jgi:hypothetical protein
MQIHAAGQARGPNPIDPSVGGPGAVRCQRHRPEEIVPHRVVAQHLPAFQRALAERDLRYRASSSTSSAATSPAAAWNTASSA